MKIFNNVNISKGYKFSALAIGNFDGLHKGHQKVFSETKRFADNKKISHHKDKTELFVEDFRITQISPKTSGNTFYSLNGDVFSWLCLLLTGLLGFASRKQR